MIRLTRLNGREHYLNALLMESMEATPDTVITLTSGKKLVVRETIPEVLAAVAAFYREINAIKAVTMQQMESEGGEEE